MRKVRKIVLNKTHAYRRKLLVRLKYLVFRSKAAKDIRKVRKMGFLKASILAVCFLAFQLSIRPRVRFISRVVLCLVITLILTNILSTMLKAKEADIKVNGKAVLVANKTANDSGAEPEISAAVTLKMSPFDFKYPVNGHITQRFSSFHRAYDIATELGSDIKPLGKGKVEFAGSTADGKGNVVIVNHGEGFKSLYAHMNKINVGMGNEVDSSTVLGTVGLTGRTTGPHVHLEIYDNDLIVNPADVLPDL